MKKFFSLFAFIFLFFGIGCAAPAFADGERATVSYYYGETLVQSTEADVGTNIHLMSFTTAKNLLALKDIYLNDGTVYEWRKDGAPITEYTVTSDVTFYLVETAITNAACTVTYRYDYLSEQSFSYEQIAYTYGEAFVPPQQVNGKDITQDMYLSPAYGAENNNLWRKPDYIEEDAIVYVVLKEAARITLNGQEYSSPYGQVPLSPVKDKNFSFSGFFTDPELSSPFTGVAVNGLQLYYHSERVSYTLTTQAGETTKEWTVPTGDNVVTKDVLTDKYVWRDENGQKISVPYRVTEDVTLTGRVELPEENETQVEQEGNNGQRQLTKEEIAAIVIVSVAFLAVGGYALFTYIKKKSFAGKKSKNNEGANKKE